MKTGIFVTITFSFTNSLGIRYLNKYETLFNYNYTFYSKPCYLMLCCHFHKDNINYLRIDNRLPFTGN